MAKNKSMAQKKSSKKTAKKSPRKTVSGQIRNENKKYFEQIEGVDKFWEVKSKAGRKKIFETPDDLWNACVEYFEYNATRTINRVDFKGGFATRVVIPTPAPMSMEGLCIFLDVNTKYFNDFKDLLKKGNPIDDEFSHVISKVEQIIFKQQYEGATTGIYNANIISRRLGLADKKEIAVAEQPLFPDDIKNDSK